MARFYDSGFEAEGLLRTKLSGLGVVDRLPQYIGGTKPWHCLGCRIPDARVKVDLGFQLHESKVGFVRGGVALRQFTKDMALVSHGKASEVVWHFFASERSGKIGPSRYLLDQMERMADDLGFEFRIVLHLPE